MDSFIDDEGDDAADLEAVQLLQGLGSRDRGFAVQLLDSLICCMK